MRRGCKRDHLLSCNPRARTRALMLQQFNVLMDWLSGMDSNHDKSLQRALCYHYTTGQIAAMKINIAPENVSKIVSAKTSADFADDRRLNLKKINLRKSAPSADKNPPIESRIHWLKI
jgi:hypothetical protein